MPPSSSVGNGEGSVSVVGLFPEDQSAWQGREVRLWKITTFKFSFPFFPSSFIDLFVAFLNFMPELAMPPILSIVSFRGRVFAA